MLITKEKLNIAKYAPKHCSREALKNLYLKGDKAFVSDGSILIAVKDTEDGRFLDSGFPAVGVEEGYTPNDLVTPTTASKVLKNLPGKSPLPVLERAIMCGDSKNLKFGCTDLDTTVVVSQRNIEDKFPDVESQLTWETERVIDLDITLLEKVVKALKEFKPLDNRVSIHKFGAEEDETAGINIKCMNESGATMTALIMGLRVS